MKRNVATLTLVLALAATNGFAQEPVGTAFTYQGKLKQNGSPVTGSAEFIFTLWDAPNGGNQIGQTVQTGDAHPVVDGLFTVELDFNPPTEWIFDGTAFWLEVQVDYPAGSGSWETLSPRQRITATPFASFSTLSTAVPWVGILDMPAGFADGVDDIGDGSFWSLTGNAGTTPGTNFLGTTDDTALELHVNGMRALRLEPHTSGPNIVAGDAANTVDPGVLGATIAGGVENMIHTEYGVIGGGRENEAGNIYAVVSGGYNNVASGTGSTVSGGYYQEASGAEATIAGGNSNVASGNYSTVGGGVANTASSAHTTICGGYNNVTSAGYATVGGGSGNVIGDIAGWSTIAGGQNNEATQEYAMIPGGSDNLAGGEWSFAAGYKAKVRRPEDVGGGDTNGDEGTFVWSDRSGDEFWSTAPNQFLVRADGGVGIGTNNPQAELHVAGEARAGSFRLDSSYAASGSFAHSDTLGGTLTLQYAPVAIANQVLLSSVEGIEGWAGTDRFRLRPSDGGDTGAILELLNAGWTTLRLDAAANNGAGQVEVKDATSTTRVTLDSDTGTTTTEILVITGGSDLSEQFNVSSESATHAPGMVVCIDPTTPGDLRLSSKAYDRTVAGIISGAGDVRPGMLMSQHNTVANGALSVALVGRVYCWCDATTAAIRPGDLLTTSDVPGHAMRAMDCKLAAGAIIGKAMTRLDEGRGLVLVLVALQ